MNHSGWYVNKRFKVKHFFYCGESYALPTYGGSYGGPSDRGTPYANSACGKLSLRQISETLRKKQPVIACKACLKSLKSTEKKLARLEAEEEKTIKWLTEMRDEEFDKLDLVGKIIHIAFGHYSPPTLSREEKEEEIRKLLKEKK